MGLVPEKEQLGGAAVYDAAARAAYAEIRLSGMSDIPTVARNTELTVEEVTTLQNIYSLAVMNILLVLVIELLL